MTGALPTLSEIENWSTAHLDDAAEKWPQLGKHSVDVATQHRDNMAAPAGTEWHGQTHEAAFEAADNHASRVSAQSSLIDEAGSIAKSGSADVRAMRQLVLEAVAEAQQDGFRVNQDLSVTDTKPHPQQTATRVQSGQGHAEFIRWRAGQLVATDDQVNARLQTKATEIHGSVQSPQVHAVDFQRDTPRDPPKPDPKGPHPDYPGRTNDGKFGKGNNGDGKFEEKIALDKREQRTKIPIIRQKVRAVVPGALNPDGSQQWRYYDGLEPTGNPNEYIGIEGKRDGVKLSGPQAKFDPLVTPENPARATLNGEPIRIVGTEVAYPKLPPGTGPLTEMPAGGGGVSEGPVARGGAGEGGGFRFGGGGGALVGLPEQSSSPGHGLEIYPADPGPLGGGKVAEVDGKHHDE
ncbi:putative conserved membrane protein [Mycobacteroides abscessus subsp. bolletii]|uniref:Conserved membrane protein n=1 Tax=Mycobacteroides abscessus subsp. bolletii TaxID=319705 RepID=A0A9Q7WJ17_9MYCO|nr:hypothetical protein [Mycobacteroides abscessus]SHT86856.1 putative conserved membrane protein [Mycobacteroides abscessus subsp. bolletii]SHU01464.1 putative conserved membrane protein [Mycobacteroides abscessus subsp. bolletii]SHX43675.1 putative conserved membrane protein [Mycobacteroides abscessus subsp. bolletii]SKM63458.1 putative conserved membrane protein [Mycobacteroides abscessus subsp. bolletii]SKN38293.1 putative conserved membrane protein [Mycobacteroides abscessus subsp. bollet